MARITQPKMTEAPAEPRAMAPASPIVIPSPRIRSVTIGVLIAVIFASLSFGFAFGRVTAPASSGFGTGSSGGFGSGFPRPGGGFGGGQGGQGGQGGGTQNGGTAPKAP